MKKNPCYALQTLHGVPYLLPFGQAVADLRRGVRLDGNGVFLWEAMDEAGAGDGLVERFLAHVGGEPGDRAALRADVEQFLNTLTACGILLPDAAASAGPCTQTLRIGGLTLRLLGKPEYFSEELKPFAAEVPGTADQIVIVAEEMPPVPVGARLTLRNPELVVWEGEDRWYLFYPQSQFLRQAELTRDGSAARYYVAPPLSESGWKELRFDLFHAMRLGYLYLAGQRGLFALHSASILYRERAWLFSGPSGMGKSTQAGLWREAFGVPCLNGDLNLLSLRDGEGREQPGKVFVHGLPWCGTSGISTTQTVELGGVILLRQDREDRVELLAPDKKQLMVMNRLISPSWTEEMAAANLAFAGALADRAAVWRYRCTKELSAAHTLRAHIDTYLKEVADT